MEKVIGMSTVGRQQNIFFLNQKKTGLKWNNESFVRVNRYRIHGFKIKFSFSHNFRTEEKSASEGGVNMKPNFVFFTNFSDFINWINGSLNSSSHGSIYEHANIVFFHLLLNAFLELRWYHSSRMVSLDVN
jgi:hypothetical protein